MIKISVFMSLISLAHAAQPQYVVKIDRTATGLAPVKSSLVVKSGEEAALSLSKKELDYLYVSARPGTIQGHQGVLIEFRQTHSKDDGQKTHVAKGSSLVKLGQPATITTVDEKTGNSSTTTIIVNSL